MSDQRLVSCSRTELLSRSERFEVWRLEPVDVTVGRLDDVDNLVTFAPGDAISGDGGWVIKQVAADAADHSGAADALRAEARWQATAAGAGVLPVAAVVGPPDPEPESAEVGVVTPWMASGSLTDVIDRGATWTLNEIVDRLAELARTLAAVHLRGVVHGDVSPGNVLVTNSSPMFVLSDFGCAGPAERHHVARESVGVASGTPGFAAPEVVAGSPPVTASDVFSLGAVGVALLDRLTGASSGPQRGSPGDRFPEDTRVAVVESWCRELCAADLDARPRDLCAAAGVLEVLAGVPDDRVVCRDSSTISRTVEFGPRPVHPSDPDEPTGPPPAWFKRRLAAMIGIVVLIGVGAFGWWDKRSEPARAQYIEHSVRLAADEPRTDVRSAPVAGPKCSRSGVIRALSASQPTFVDALSLGCAQELTWSDRTLTIRPTATGDDEVTISRYRIGRDGDAVFVAEWECEGHVRPRIYRPSTGEIISYPGIPDVPGAGGALLPHAEPPLAAAGMAHVKRDGRGCVQLVVDP